MRPIVQCSQNDWRPEHAIRPAYRAILALCSWPVEAFDFFTLSSVKWDGARGIGTQRLYENQLLQAMPRQSIK
jgi:hypothetical protein